MVNKIPSYTIGAGGRIAVVSSRSHPGAARIMVPACCDALESSGVDTDDIYIMDVPGDLLLPGVCRELSRSGFYSAIVALTILPARDSVAVAFLNGMTTTDFAVPVIPGVVYEEGEPAVFAHVAEDAARAAVELTNLAGIMSEMAKADYEPFPEEAAPAEEAPPQAARSRRSKKGTAAATPSRRKGRAARSKASTAGAKKSKGTTRKSKPVGGASSNPEKRRGRPRKQKV